MRKSAIINLPNGGVEIIISDTGVGVRGSLNRRWVNDRGHKWLSEMEWSQRRSGFTTQYRVPSLRRVAGQHD